MNGFENRLRSPATGHEVVGGGERSGAIEASWRRCVDRYGLDRSSADRVNVLTASELRDHREPLERMLVPLGEEVEQFAAPLADCGFTASFADMAGIIVDYRSDLSSDNFVEIERAGSLWAEGAVGTNGVGTCVVERRPVRIFKTQHFARTFGSLSCASAPILSAEADMIGVLNLSTADANLSDQTFRLVCGMTEKIAERVGNCLFALRYENSRILKATVSGVGRVMLALDDHQALIGANDAARRWLQLRTGRMSPVDLWTVFERNAGAATLIAAGNGPVLLHREGEAVVFSNEGRQPSVVEVTVLGSPKKKESLSRPERAIDDKPSVDECLGSDPLAHDKARVLRRVYGSGLPVLILGETGTGKDTLAGALHREGHRREKPFVAFNCAAVPETLIDSELFGYGVGAFTGAKRDGNTGRLVEADGGTLFLDEIGDMPLALQTRLLRVLESGEVTPLGSGKTRRIDIHVIAATNHDLMARMREGLFREDLYYRLAAFVVHLPPLRERRDLRPLIQSMFERMKQGRALHLTDEALATMLAHPWRGNARELKFVLQRAVQVCDDGRVTALDLMLDGADAHDRLPVEPPGCASSPDTARGAIAAAERAAIVTALSKTPGDIERCAESLRISRATLYRRMRQYDLKPIRQVKYT